MLMGDRANLVNYVAIRHNNSTSIHTQAGRLILDAHACMHLSFPNKDKERKSIIKEKKNRSRPSSVIDPSARTCVLVSRL